MGDKIRVIDIQVIQGGLFQIDLMNDTTQEAIRFFAEPYDLFQRVGNALQLSHNSYLKDRFGRVEE